MNGLWMLFAIGLVVSGVGGSLWLDHTLRRADEAADDFYRRLAALPDLDRPEAGHDIPTLPSLPRGGGVVPGGRAMHPDRGVLGASPTTRHRGRAPDPRI